MDSLIYVLTEALTAPRKRTHAKLHKFSCGSSDIDCDASVISITEDMHGGDILECQLHSGYRSNGVYAYSTANGSHIIELNYKYDHYGSVPIEFCIITEFEPGYWNANGFVKYNPRFYWHIDPEIQNIDTNKLGIAGLSDTYIRFKYNEIEYLLINQEGELLCDIIHVQKCGRELYYGTDKSIRKGFKRRNIFVIM